MARISTGIEGLDKMLHGGLISGRAYLVKGGPGTGKTTLTIHFLMEGVRNNEKVLYITLEEPLDPLKQDMKKLGLDISTPLFKGIDATPIGERSHIFEGTYHEEFAKSFGRLVKAIKERLDTEEFTRVVIDPITMVKLTIENDLEYRRTFIGFLKDLAKYNVTLLITSELHETDLEDYLVSGVIELRTYEISGKVVRGIKILKFRGSSFDEQIRPYRLTDRGFEIYSEEGIFVGD
ncbi:AAA family ATPase [Thermococcus argininiproducens]|uniref:AAA family ATPase n=1 Tax=Thermococcus argininiproducens TaxID=2866384 RepID=A0A9E7SCC5_9EURY|nr:ATPase domain-containing protein [Thermococcus argininiproducens]USG99665.1 AAA family ATPase [Thermococcus argininiproducens]